METPRTPILETEKNNLANGRVSLNYLSNPIYVGYREIDFSLSLTSPLIFHNSNVNIRDLAFNDCIFHKDVNLGDYQSAGKITFDACSFDENVTIATNINISFDPSCVFKKNLTINNVNPGSYVQDLTVEGRLEILGRHDLLNIFSIKSLLGGLIINIDGVCNNLTIANSSCHELYVNVLLTSKSRAHIRNVQADKIAVQYRSSECNLYVLDCAMKDFNCGNLFEGKNNISIKNCSVSNKIRLDLNGFDLAQIEGSNLSSLELKGTNAKESILTILKSTISNLLFGAIINDGLFSFNEVSIPKDGQISILSSNLGKTKFINCKINDAKFEFNNSQIIELFLAETDFPNKVFVANQLNAFQGQLAFGQLATVFQKQGDSVRALEYQSRELESHYKTIKLFRKEPKFINLTKVALWLNKWSNDFGRNWGYGIVFSFLVGGLFFYLLVISSKQFSIGFGFSFDPKMVSSYLKFMNPLRFFDTESLFRLNTEPSYLILTWSSYIWDFLGRIFVAYGFYQTIQAFRRFGRK